MASLCVSYRTFMLSFLQNFLAMTYTRRGDHWWDMGVPNKNGILVIGNYNDKRLFAYTLNYVHGWFTNCSIPTSPITANRRTKRAIEEHSGLVGRRFWTRQERCCKYYHRQSLGGVIHHSLGSEREPWSQSNAYFNCVSIKLNIGKAFT